MLKTPWIVPALVGAALACSESASETTAADVQDDASDSTCAAASGPVQPGDADPANACRVCGDDNQFASAPDGQACPGGTCSGGACVPSCAIAGVTYADGAANPADPCQLCAAGTATDAWTTAADGTACGPNRFCGAGVCNEGCVIDGAFVLSGATSPTNPCLQCTPAASTSAWTPLPSGMGCGAGQVCVAGECEDGCFLEGKLVAPQAPSETNTCLVCSPDSSTTAWAQLPNGAACGEGQRCATRPRARRAAGSTTALCPRALPRRRPAASATR